MNYLQKKKKKESKKEMWSSVIICANVNYFSDLVSSFEIQFVSITLLIYV